MITLSLTNDFSITVPILESTAKTPNPTWLRPPPPGLTEDSHTVQGGRGGSHIGWGMYTEGEGKEEDLSCAEAQSLPLEDPLTTMQPPTED